MSEMTEEKTGKISMEAKTEEVETKKDQLEEEEEAQMEQVKFYVHTLLREVGMQRRNVPEQLRSLTADNMADSLERLRTRCQQFDNHVAEKLCVAAVPDENDADGDVIPPPSPPEGAAELQEKMRDAELWSTMRDAFLN